MNALPILTVQGIDCYEQDGTVFLKLEHVARGLGFTQEKNGVEYVRWETVNSYLGELGFPNKLGKADFIPENIFYRLAMKAKNEAAEAFQAKIADEVIPSIRRTGGYLTPELAKALADLPTMMELLEGMEERLSALETAGVGVHPVRLLAPPRSGLELEATPGLAAKKRWMRIVSEKLSLLSVRLDMTHNEILHRLYVLLENDFGVSLEEERMQVMEEYRMTECSVLGAIFYNQSLREALQRLVDYNLAPENRGW